MAKRPSKWILPARYLWFLTMFLVLSGCAQADQGELSPSAPGNEEVVKTEPADSFPGTTPVPPILNLTQNPHPANPETTETALGSLDAARRAEQTQGAQIAGTQAARAALGTLSSIATAAFATPSQGPANPGLPTPTPVTLLEQHFEPLVSFESVLPGLLTDMRMSPGGVLWAINENGIASLNGSSWTLHFPEVILWLAGFDENGRTWMLNEPATAALSYNGSEWRIYGEGEGWLPVRDPRRFYLSEEMVSDRNGKVWMTAYQDIRSFDGSTWTVHSLRELGFEPFEETAQYDGISFPAIEKDSQGDIWVGNCDKRGEELAGQGARWFDGASWQGKTEPTSTGCVQDIEVDSNGRVWMGIDDLLWRYDPETRNWTRIELPEPPADIRIGWVQDLQFGLDGNPWLVVALCGGGSCGSSFQRYRLEQNEWIKVPQLNDFDPGRLYFDPAGNTWLYSEKKLYRLQGDTLAQVQGVEFCCITQDSRGWLYLAAKLGQLKLILVERGER